MGQSPSSEANIFSANQEVIQYLCNPNLKLPNSRKACTFLRTVSYYTLKIILEVKQLVMTYLYQSTQ
jgi:hypothetical protein